MFFGSKNSFSNYRQHAQQTIDQNPLWVFLQDCVEREFFETAWISSVVAVDFLLSLATSEKWISHVDDDAFISVVIIVL